MVYQTSPTFKRSQKTPTLQLPLGSKRQKSLQQATQNLQTSRMRAELPTVQLGAMTLGRDHREQRLASWVISPVVRHVPKIE
jgi:hypothetical protein